MFRTIKVDYPTQQSTILRNRLSAYGNRNTLVGERVKVTWDWRSFMISTFRHILVHTELTRCLLSFGAEYSVFQFAIQKCKV